MKSVQAGQTDRCTGLTNICRHWMDKLIRQFNALLRDTKTSHDLYNDDTSWGSLEWQSWEDSPYWIWWYDDDHGLDMIGLCQHLVSRCESPALVEVVLCYSHARTSDDSMFRHVDLACQENRPILLKLDFRETLTEEGPIFSWCPVEQFPPRNMY